MYEYEEEPKIVFVEELPLGFEPVVTTERYLSKLLPEFWRLRKNGVEVMLCDNGDGTLGMWERKAAVFWIQDGR